MSLDGGLDILPDLVVYSSGSSVGAAVMIGGCALPTRTVHWLLVGYGVSSCSTEQADILWLYLLLFWRSPSSVRSDCLCTADYPRPSSSWLLVPCFVDVYCNVVVLGCCLRVCYSVLV